jgi:hypothetical protein
VQGVPWQVLAGKPSRALPVRDDVGNRLTVHRQDYSLTSSDRVDDLT